MNTSINGFYARVALGFANLADTLLIAFVRNVITLMAALTGQYPKPSPTLAVITGLVDVFETAVHTALNGGRIEIGLRNAARADLLGAIRQLAAYVQGNCDADVQNIIATGFEAVRSPTPAGVLDTPGNQRLEYPKTKGALLLRFDRVVNAANYSVQIAETPDGPWADRGLSTTTRVTLDGLTAGTVYWVRACANGSQGPSEWGGPATAMAV